MTLLRPSAAVALTALALNLAAAAYSGESVSVGTTGKGSLKGGVSLPAEGAGFVTYSRLGNSLGRQYVHSRVRDTLAASFAALHAQAPERVFVVGETGLRKGGQFRPHKTHQNGLSVDIFMPVRNTVRRWVPMPTALSNKLGYSLEFDVTGQGHGLAIDFAELAALLVELRRQAGRHGLTLERVIVAPEYVPLILDAGGPPELARLAPLLSRRRAWVRHDEHVHVDFRLDRAAPRTPETPKGIDSKASRR